jgi:cysteine synthase
MLVLGSLPVSAIAATHSPALIQGWGTAGTPAGVSHREHVGFVSMAGQRIQNLCYRRLGDHMLVLGSLPVSATAATHPAVLVQGCGTAGTPAGVSA